MNQKIKLVAAIVMLLAATGIVLYTFGVFEPKPATPTAQPGGRIRRSMGGPAGDDKPAPPESTPAK